MKKGLGGPICGILAIALMCFLSFSIEALTVVPAAGQSVSGTPSGKPQNEKIPELTDGQKAKHFQDLLAGGTTGTAWPISSRYVVTNSHVVSEGSKVTLVSSQGEEIPASAVLRDKTNDIIILEVKDPHALPPALPLAQSQARLGASVFTIGFPRVDFMGRAPKLSIGVISGESGLRDDPESIQTTMPIQPGNSGGPLLNMRGEVVGVVKSMLGVRDTDDGNFYVLQTTSCALKIKCVQELVYQLPQKDSQAKLPPVFSNDLETLAGRIKDSILLVISKKGTE
ncbi:MAG: S1 family peptidase [Thermodesulfobacteriota bacterium]